MSERSVGLDVLRAACVAGVLITHFSPFFLDGDGASGWARRALSLGSFGVTGFFLLSAYLLTSILLREVAAKRPHIWRRYWIRRSLRIWPLYFFAILVYVIVALATGTGVPGLPWLATFTYNWVSWEQPNPLLGHFWSMGAEEQLYVLIPILCFIAFARRWPFLVGLIVIAPIARWITADLLPYPAVWNFTTSHLDVFAIGVLLASLDHSRTPRWQRIRVVLAGNRWVAAAVALLSAGLIAASAVSPEWVFGSRATTFTYLAVAIVWAWCLLKATGVPRSRAGLSTRAAVWVGQRSYGIYVYHWPAAVLGMSIAAMIPVPTPVIGVVMIAAALLVSESSYRWLEQPFLRLKSRFSTDKAQIGENSGN